MGIKVLAAFSNLLLSEGVSRLLEGESDIEVTLLEAGKVCPSEYLDSVVLTDLFTLNSSFSDLDSSKKLRFILFDTDNEEDSAVSTIASRNINGFLLGGASPPVLKRAIRAVANGGVWIDRAIVKDLLHAMKALKPCALTGREKEIVGLVGKGLRNREIAGSLKISELTVKAHLHRIFKKLNIRTRSQLITYSIRKTTPGGRLREKPGG